MSRGQKPLTRLGLRSGETGVKTTKVDTSLANQGRATELGAGWAPRQLPVARPLGPA